MKFSDAQRAHLQQLHEFAIEAQKATQEADNAVAALNERDRRRRNQYSDPSEDSEGDDSDRSEDIKVEDRKSDTEFADEEHEDFYFEEKLQRLEKAAWKCTFAARQAQDAFVVEFESCIKPQVSSSLTALHNMMLAKLPMESRDMIYSYLVTRAPGTPEYIYQPAYDPNFHYFQGAKIDDELNRSRRAFDEGTFEFMKPGGWLLNADYVGRDMARELAESYYGGNEFHVTERTLGELLIQDRTYTGLKPYDYIRGKLDVRITTTYCNG